MNDKQEKLKQQIEIQKKLSSVYNDEAIAAEKKRLAFICLRDDVNKNIRALEAELVSGYPARVAA